MSRLSLNCTIDGCINHIWSRQMCRKHYARWHTHGDPHKVLTKQTKAGDPGRFLDNLPTEGGGCITWPFSTNGVGYGMVSLGGQKRGLVTRVVCERINGPAPSSEHFAAHECGNGHLGCVAPWHLSWKTPAENSADREIHGTLVRGEACPFAKLTEDDVRQIRALPKPISPKALAKKYGVSPAAIRKAALRINWKHVA